MKIWYYARGGERFGPFTIEDLKAAAVQGSFCSDDLIWKDGLQSWIKAGQVNGLFPKSVPPPIPTATPPPIPAAPRPAVLQAPINTETPAPLDDQTNKENNNKPRFLSSLSGFYWLTVCLGLAVFTYYAVDHVNAGDTKAALKDAGAAALFLIVSPAAWKLADAFRQFAAPSLYFGRGIFDLAGKRLFWMVGPQVVTLGAVGLALILWIEGKPFLVEERPSGITPHVVAASTNRVAATEHSDTPAASPVPETASVPQLTSDQLAALAALSEKNGAPQQLPADLTDVLGLTQNGQTIGVRQIVVSQDRKFFHGFAQLPENHGYILTAKAPDFRILCQIDKTGQVVAGVEQETGGHALRLALNQLPKCAQKEIPFWLMALKSPPTYATQ
ncbi:MAG: DUF4339 domain-containing protein [Nevskia sp.]|nr:DUF4339 domain-containing protein [Nevskia sp.]